MRRFSPLLLALVADAGCTFPDVTIKDQPGDSTIGDSGSNDAKIDTTVADNGGDTTIDDVGGDADEDVFIPDTNPPDIGPETPPCDKDGDGYQPVGGTCSPGTKGADCDDLTAAANPGVKAFTHAKPPASLKPPGDWDCSGTVDKEFTVVSSCPGLSAGCDTRGGVQVVTGCGEAVKIVTCVVDTILGCKDGAIKDGLQGCK